MRDLTKLLLSLFALLIIFVIASEGAIITDTGKRWDYVVIGDFVLRGVVDEYEKIIEDDLGVKVNTHRWIMSSSSSSELLEKLKTNSRLRRELTEAEIIVFQIPWNGWEAPMRMYETGDEGTCGGPENQDCLATICDTYKSDTVAIFAEIVSLKSPSSAIIRTMDTYQYQARESKEAGTFEVINRYWWDANESIWEEAQRYGLVVAPVYEAFMGETGLDDPIEKGLLFDSFRTTPEGNKLIAELFRETGFEPFVIG